MTVQNIKNYAKSSNHSSLKKKKKEKEKNESDCGKVYALANQTKIVCSNWSKNREYLFGEVLDSPVRITVMVPKDYVLMEVKQNGSNKTS